MAEIDGRQTLTGIGGAAPGASSAHLAKSAEGLRSSGTRRGLGADLDKIELEAEEVVRSEKAMSSEEARREAQRVSADALGHLPLTDAARAIAAEASAMVTRAKAAERSEHAPSHAAEARSQEDAIRAYSETADSARRFK